LVEGLHVDYYGTPTLVKQLAAITVPDPHLIVIQPWGRFGDPGIGKSDPKIEHRDHANE